MMRGTSWDDVFPRGCWTVLVDVWVRWSERNTRLGGNGRKGGTRGAFPAGGRAAVQIVLLTGGRHDIGVGQPAVAVARGDAARAQGLHFRALLGFPSPIRQACVARGGRDSSSSCAWVVPLSMFRIRAVGSSALDAKTMTACRRIGTQAARNEASSGLSSSMRRAAKSHQLWAIREKPASALTMKNQIH